MPITRLIIPAVDVKHSVEYIANVFWKQHIAQISSLTLISYLKNNIVVQMAFIEIAYWCDTEVAYNTIQRLKVHEGEARVTHNDDEWWPVHIDYGNMGQRVISVYTTFFPETYYADDAVEPVIANSKNVTLRSHQTAYVM